LRIAQIHQVSLSTGVASRSATSDRRTRSGTVTVGRGAGAAMLGTPTCSTFLQQPNGNATCAHQRVKGGRPGTSANTPRKDNLPESRAWTFDSSRRLTIGDGRSTAVSLLYREPRCTQRLLAVANRDTHRWRARSSRVELRVVEVVNDADDWTQCQLRLGSAPM